VNVLGRREELSQLGYGCFCGRKEEVFIYHTRRLLCTRYTSRSTTKIPKLFDNEYRSIHTFECERLVLYLEHSLADLHQQLSAFHFCDIV